MWLDIGSAGYRVAACALLVFPVPLMRTSCVQVQGGVFMACAALAVLRALRDGRDPLQPTLDFEQKHMNWLRVHMVHRYCNAIPPLTNP